MSTESNKPIEPSPDLKNAGDPTPLPPEMGHLGQIVMHSGLQPHRRPDAGDRFDHSGIQ